MRHVHARRRPLIAVLALAGVLAALVAGGVMPATAQLSDRVASKESRADRLRAALAEETRKISDNAGGLERAEARLAKVKRQNAVQQAELELIASKLRKTRIRLTRLQNRLMASFEALRNNLVEGYRNPQPDLVGVVLGAHDFADLIEKRDFYKRISKQNADIMAGARKMRVTVQEHTDELAKIQRRERVLADRLQKRTDEASTLQAALLTSQQQRLRRRNAASSELRTVNSQLSDLRERLMRSAAPSGPNGEIAVKPGGEASPSAGAPAAVARVLAAGNAIAGLPYVYGGGHAGFKAAAYDCSGSVSYALGAAGLVNAPMASGGFFNWGEAGEGKWITIYTKASHMFMVVDGWRFDTTALRQGGTRWTRAMRPTAGFTARHPPGL